MPNQFNIQDVIADLMNPNNQMANQIRAQMNQAMASGMSSMENMAPDRGLDLGSGRGLDMAQNMYQGNIANMGNTLMQQQGQRTAQATPLVQSQFEQAEAMRRLQMEIDANNSMYENQARSQMWGSLLGGAGKIGASFVGGGGGN